MEFTCGIPNMCCEVDNIDKKRFAGWKHLWDAPDKSFKGRCENCGFVHLYVEGHDAQYNYWPQCGEKKH